jgi:hypothetical protein
MLHWINDFVKSTAPMDHKLLEQYRGFLIHISRTYPSIVPYLKGIHLMFDSWRDNCDAFGSKLPMPELKAAIALKGHSIQLESFTFIPPKFFTAIPQLHFDIDALLMLFSSDQPLNVLYDH